MDYFIAAATQDASYIILESLNQKFKLRKVSKGVQLTFLACHIKNEGKEDTTLGMNGYMTRSTTSNKARGTMLKRCKRTNDGKINGY